MCIHHHSIQNPHPLPFPRIHTFSPAPQSPSRCSSNRADRVGAPGRITRRHLSSVLGPFHFPALPPAPCSPFQGFAGKKLNPAPRTTLPRLGHVISRLHLHPCDAGTSSGGHRAQREHACVHGAVAGAPIGTAFVTRRAPAASEFLSIAPLLCSGNSPHSLMSLSASFLLSSSTFAKRVGLSSLAPPL